MRRLIVLLCKGPHSPPHVPLLPCTSVTEQAFPIRVPCLPYPIRVKINVGEERAHQSTHDPYLPYPIRVRVRVWL